jgi:phosphotransferase system  glucose/maltose/N-acetylglucosamine-specific IIC component
VIFDNASEGLHVILGMLVVGGIFLGVIVLGELTHWAGARRKARRNARRPSY